MISPQSIAIAVSATKMDGQANQIMSGTMKYCCAYIVILGLKVGLFYYWVYGVSDRQPRQIRGNRI